MGSTSGSQESVKRGKKRPYCRFALPKTRDLKRFAKGSILLQSAHFSTLRPTASASQHVAGFAGRLVSISAVYRRAARSIISRTAVRGRAGAPPQRRRHAPLPTLPVAGLAGLAVFGDDELGELFYRGIGDGLVVL